MAGRVEGAVAIGADAAPRQGRSRAVWLFRDSPGIIATDAILIPASSLHDLAEIADFVTVLSRRLAVAEVDVRDVEAYLACPVDLPADGQATIPIRTLDGMPHPPGSAPEARATRQL